MPKLAEPDPKTTCWNVDKLVLDYEEPTDADPECEPFDVSQRLFALYSPVTEGFVYQTFDELEDSFLMTFTKWEFARRRGDDLDLAEGVWMPWVEVYDLDLAEALQIAHEVPLMPQLKLPVDGVAVFGGPKSSPHGEYDEMLALFYSNRLFYDAKADRIGKWGKRKRRSKSRGGSGNEKGGNP